MESVEKTSNYLGGTGVGLGAGALGWLLLNTLNGGNILGGGNREPAATQRDLCYERQLTEKDAKIGKLEAQQYADAAVLAAERRLTDKIEKVETAMNTAATAQQVFNSTISSTVANTFQQVQQLMAMTGLYIKQPVMAASEAVLNALKPASTATAAAAG